MYAPRRSLKPIAASIAVASAILMMPAAQAQAPAQVAKVNGVAIPQSRMDVVLKMLAANKQPDTPENRTRIREQLINQEIVSQEAIKKGLDKNPEIAAQLDLQRQETLANAYVQDFVKANPVTDEAMRKEFDQKIKPTIPAKEYKVRHILVEKEDEAKEILAVLKKGGSFEKLAADKSKDPGSKTRGGDLDWSAPNRYVKPFADALAKLKKGQTTDPAVQTDYGWHIIRLDDERNTKVPSFEEVKPKVQEMMQSQQVQKMLSEIRAKAKIE
jgi:peptidyl-prolyl cis-trans isomerase C